MRTTHSSNHLGGGGLYQAPPQDQAPPGPGPSWDKSPPQDQTPGTRHPPDGAPPRCGQKHTCKHITLPQNRLRAVKMQCSFFPHLPLLKLPFISLHMME